MPKYDYDLFAIGAGSGGVRACRMAAVTGARVAVAEERYLGGTCVNVGCIPKKLFVYAAHFAEDFKDTAGFGWTVGAQTFDWPHLIANKNKEISRLNGIYDRLLKNAGVEVFDGHAVLEDAHTVKIGEKTYTAETILVATGGWPFVPDIPGKEHAITSNEAFYLDDMPRRVIVVGGGYIAVEFAGIFNGLGAEVTQVYRGPLFLRGFDEDVRGFLSGEMSKKGVDLRFDTDIARIEKVADGLRAVFNDGSELTTDCIMYATGRKPLTADIGLEAAGIALADNGAIKVDDYFQTSVANIYAIGDVIDRIALTPVAIAEGMALVKTLFGGVPTKVDYADVPSAVFSQPSVGSVGLTEAQSREKYGSVDIYTSDFSALKNTLSGNDERTFMKLIVDRASDRVVGVHMVGPDAGEIIQGIAIAVKCGATKAQFDATVGVHPSAAEEFVTMREPVVEPLPDPKQAVAE
jgi:glutathione reductase (NADPH)